MPMKSATPHATRVNSLVRLLGILMVFVAAGPVFGQEAPPPTRPATEAPGRTDGVNALVEPNEDYRISPGDVIEIAVDRAPELSGSFRVSASGSIPMKHLGTVKVGGLTQEQVASVVADGLRGNYLKNPFVTVTVKQINSHVFFIQGSVNRPGSYQMEGRPSLLKLITVAGGLTENHGSIAFVIRPKSHAAAGEKDAAPAGQPLDATTETTAVKTSLDQQAQAPPAAEERDQYDVSTVNINGLLRGKFDEDIAVEPGSLINIPRMDVFFVAGEVRAPGSFPLKEGTTLRQAVSMAQGTTFSASPKRGLIFRDDASGKRQQVKVDISAIMSGKQEDIVILANDIIIVPNSTLKSVSETLLRTLGVNSMRLPLPAGH